jgi:hypothetical protein
LEAEDPALAQELRAKAKVDAPIVDHRFNFVWRAYDRLSSDRKWRSGGMGPSVPGQIPWSVVRQWAEEHNLTYDDKWLMDACFQAMDALYIEWWNEQQKARAKEP